MYTLKEDFMKAKDYFEQALKAGMENSDLFYMLGQTLIKLEQPKLAMPYLQRAVELNEEDNEARFQFGMCLANEHMLEEAVTTFTEVITRDPQHADAFYNLGVAYAYLEKKTKHLRCWVKPLTCSLTICWHYMRKS